MTELLPPFICTENRNLQPWHCYCLPPASLRMLGGPIGLSYGVLSEWNVAQAITHLHARRDYFVSRAQLTTATRTCWSSHTYSATEWNRGRCQWVKYNSDTHNNTAAALGALARSRSLSSVLTLLAWSKDFWHFGGGDLLDTCPLRYVSATPAEQIHFTLVYVSIPTRSSALRICSGGLQTAGADMLDFYIWQMPEHNAAIQQNLAPSRQEVKNQNNKQHPVTFQNKTLHVDGITRVSN